jgi:hypothetical protein
MTDIEKARQLFRNAGLAFPTIPEELSEQLKEHGRWLFSTRPLDMSPYNLQHYLEEVEVSQVKDYAVLSHSGHGVNSYAIQYYLVNGSLRMFLHLGWGGVYSDRREDEATIRDCFSMADHIVRAAQGMGRFQAGERLTIVGSDFYGSYWIPPGESRRGEIEGRKGPLKVLAEVFDWLTRYRRGKSDTTRRSTMNVTAKAKGALHGSFSGVADDKGYTLSPQENLLPDIDWKPIEIELRNGDGDELRMKFNAVHSSAALAVNCFGPFKSRPERLLLLRKRGWKLVEFEMRLPIFGPVGAPNVDVWIDRGQEAVAVESKLLEYLTPKKPKFSDAFERLAPECDPIWWNVYEQSKGGEEQHLDRAQLIKHYFGLNKFRQKNPEGLRLTLLYIFWEPLDWEKVPECVQHRKEVKDFAHSLSNSQIRFEWKSYNELWEEWQAVPELEAHAQELKKRYQVRLQT